MTHKYPFGAIESEKPLVMGLLGQTLYGVHGLGSSSWLTEMRNVRNLHTTESLFGHEGFRAVEWTYHDEDLDSHSCLGDFNIGAHHNHHYLFHDRRDAEAYLAWAKENTPEIKDDPWWDSYDTWCDDHDYDYPEED